MYHIYFLSFSKKTWFFEAFSLNSGAEPTMELSIPASIAAQPLIIPLTAGGEASICPATPKTLALCTFSGKLTSWYTSKGLFEKTPCVFEAKPNKLSEGRRGGWAGSGASCPSAPSDLPPPGRPSALPAGKRLGRRTPTGSDQSTLADHHARTALAKHRVECAGCFLSPVSGWVPPDPRMSPNSTRMSQLASELGVGQTALFWLAYITVAEPSWAELSWTG